MQRVIKYDLAKFKDCEDQDGRKIASFTIRTTDGTDETYASKRAEANGTSMSEELIRFSFVAYECVSEDKTIEIKCNVGNLPFEGFDKWSTKARNFVLMAWKRVATPSEADVADFFASATEIN